MMLFQLGITPLTSKRHELIDILRYVSGPTSRQHDCLNCEIFEGSGDDQTVQFVEMWDTTNDLHRYIQSDLFSKLLSAMELSQTQPVVRFCEISKTWGMELVESLRNQEKQHR